LCKIFRGAATDPEDILLDLFGGEAASLRAADAYRATLTCLGLDWPKLGESHGR